MARNALEIIQLRNNFYRDSYRKVAIALVLSLILNIIAISIVGYFITHPPKSKYFATTDSGKVIRMIPLNEPNMSPNAIRSWTVTAVMSIYDFNFANYRKAFSDNQKYFTNKGWNGFLKQLKLSGTIKAVKDQKLIISSVPNGTAVITSQRSINGRYYWRVQVPMLIQYQSQSTNFNNNVMITLTIGRISTLKNNFGIGIVSFVIANR